MKRLVAGTLALLLLLAGCSQTGSGTKLGLASKTVMNRSTDLADANGVKSGTTLSDTMMCAVTVDSAGKVVNIRFDDVQAPIAFDATGKITTDKSTLFKTKRELGNDYGMKKASGIGKEWFEEVDAIEKWMTGKTADQIKAMKVKTTQAEGEVSDEPDLASGATIGVSDFIEVAAAAIANAK